MSRNILSPNILFGNSIFLLMSSNLHQGITLNSINLPETYFYYNLWKLNQPYMVAVHSHQLLKENKTTPCFLFLGITEKDMLLDCEIPDTIWSCISFASKKCSKGARTILLLHPLSCYCEIVDGVSLFLMP
jgi:hypothetical protein